MKRIPLRLKEALTDVLMPGGHEFELDPIKRVVAVSRYKGERTLHRLDFYDGLTPSVMIAGQDFTTDVVEALCEMIWPAFEIAQRYEQPFCWRREASDDLTCRADVAYARAAQTMRAYSDGLLTLEPWSLYQTDLRAALAER